MLKDLQQRQGDKSVENSAVAMPVAIKPTPYKSVFMVTSTIVLTLVVVYAYSLYNENQQLKHESQQLLVSEQAALASMSEKTAEAKTVNTNTSTVIKKAVLAVDKNIDSAVEPQVANKKVISRQPLQSSTTHTKTNKVGGENTNNQEIIAENKAGLKLKEASKEVLKEPTSETIKAPVSMVVSRTQLSPEMLAKQKMNRAKEAVANNNITKAEQLFEDVLLVLPSQKDARKQLAALWFGRQSYQASLNLLAQGISLDPSDQDLRILTAQIHAKQGQSYQAFKILQSHPNVQSITDSKYQSMLATQAQASQQFIFAIGAYKRLSELQSNIGRWWLGLAIAYDSNSQFELASKTYGVALNKNDLSDSARQFITQRLEELGE